jgi:NAD(P)H-flavin oxidoreductase
MLEKLLEHRRAVRRYSKTNRIDTQVVQHCLELAQLAPTSSNLQLWEAYHIVDTKVLAEIAEACFGQRSVKTAQEAVVFVTRQDLYAQRAQAVFQDNVDNIRQTAPEDKIA